MFNFLLSIICLLLFGYYKLYILTNVPPFLSTHFTVMLYIYFVHFISFIFHIYFLYSLYFLKTSDVSRAPTIAGIKYQAITPQILCISLFTYILINNGNIPPGGVFHPKEVTIYNSSSLCDYYFIPNCTKNKNSLSIKGDITIQYLFNNEKMLTVSFINNKTMKDQTITLRLINPNLVWLVDNCYTSRYFMNNVSTYYQ